MKNKLIYLIVLSIFVVGCEQNVTDACLYREILKECFSAISNIPVGVKFDESVELVEECRFVAHQGSKRYGKNIKPECK
jgi:hypothetical protein